MLLKDRPIFMQNINGIERQLFLLSKKSKTFWDNPRISKLRFAFDSYLHITNMTAIGCLFDLYWSLKGYIVIC